MPVKIVTSPSDTTLGVINKTQMDNCIEKFKQDVALTTVSGNYTAIKTNSCLYAKNEILLLLGIDPETVEPNNIKGLHIHFGIHPNGQLSCKSEDYSYRVNTMLFATVEHGSDLNSVDDYMLIPGYKANVLPLVGEGDCCGGMSGGNNTNFII